MFVSDKVHAAVVKDLAVERGKRELLAIENASLKTQAQLQWVRILQLEKERAILFREVTHLPIPVPEITNLPVQSSADHILREFGGMFDHVETNDERTERERDPLGDMVPTS